METPYEQAIPVRWRKRVPREMCFLFAKRLVFGSIVLWGLSADPFVKFDPSCVPLKSYTTRVTLKFTASQGLNPNHFYEQFVNLARYTCCAIPGRKRSRFDTDAVRAISLSKGSTRTSSELGPRQKSSRRAWYGKDMRYANETDANNRPPNF